MQTAPAQRPSRSEPGLDANRGLAVVLMILAHVWRVQDHRAAQPAGMMAWLDGLLRQADRGVAFVAASFLFIAGFSLVLARRRTAGTASRSWLRQVGKRLAWLYLISIALFVPDFGLQWPELVVSSGILSVIAVSLGATALALLARWPSLWLGMLALGSWGATFWLESTQRVVAGLNAGPGGAIPLLSFCALGAMASLQYLQRGLRALVLLSTATLPLAALAWAQERPFMDFHVTRFPDHGGLAIAAWLGMTTPGEGTIAMSFWNPSTSGTIGLLAPVALLATGFLAVQHRLPTSVMARPLLLLGRHALLAYIAHLVLLGLLDLAGVAPPNAVWTLVEVVGLTAACVGLAVGSQWWRGRQRGSGAAETAAVAAQ